jgi:signal transduction histidine kinase/tetratricopeptide (TPR) repeat protein
VRVGIQLARALAAIHRRGLSHGDLKPENVVIRMAASAEVDRHSRTVLFDFASRTGDIPAKGLGDVSLQYLAPELARGGALGAATDLYALGTTLYLLGAGKLPFTAGSVSAILAAQRSREFTPLVQTSCRAPSEFNSVVEALLEPNLANRPQTADEVANALMAISPEYVDGDLAAAEDLSEIWIDRGAEFQNAAMRLEARGQLAPADALILESRPSGGVTTFLRCLQDIVESNGRTALTALPGKVAGRSIWEQIGEPLSAILRTGLASDSRASGTSDPTVGSRTAAGVLDDIHTCLHERDVILFVDQVDSCAASEVRFLRRALSQNQLSPIRRGGGRLALVLGGHGLGSEGADSVLAGLREFRLETYGVSGVTVDQLAECVSGLGLSSSVTREHCKQIISETAGAIGATKELVGLVIRKLAAGSPPGVAVSRAIRDLEFEESGVGSALLDRYSRTPEGHAALALALWGAPLSVGEWSALCQSLGASDDLHDDRWRILGTQLVRRAEGTVVAGMAELVDATRAAVRSGNQLELVATLEPLVKHRARSFDTGRVRSALRFLGRIGFVPVPLKWSALRAVLLLARRGFDGPQCVADATGGSTHSERDSGQFLELLNRFERPGGRSDSLAQQSPRRASRISDALDDDISSWAMARQSRRQGDAAQALRRLERVLQSTSAVVQSSKGAILEEAGDAALLAGDLLAAEGYAEQLRQLVLTRVGNGTLLRTLRSAPRGNFQTRAAGTAAAVCRCVRLRGRIEYQQVHLDRARACARREASLADAFGLSVRLASAKSNLAVLELRCGQSIEAIRLLRSCASTWALLDDDEGLSAALVNLAAAYSRSGQASRAISTLNRVRVVASRAGLSRRVEAATMNLGSHYARTGRIRAAHRCFSAIVRAHHGGGSPAEDPVVRRVVARASYNAGIAALELSHVQIARAHLARLERTSQADEESQASALARRLRSRLIERIDGQAAAIDALVASGISAGPSRLEMLAMQEVRWWETQGGAGERMSASDRRALESDLRFEVLCARAAQRAPETAGASLRRAARLGQAIGNARSFLGLLCGLLARTGALPEADKTAELGMTLLSAGWLREGHGDLHARARVIAASSLRSSGRDREADAVLREAAQLFGRFERRWCRSGGEPRVVEREWERIECWLKKTSAGIAREGGPCSTRMSAMVLRSVDFGASALAPGLSAGASQTAYPLLVGDAGLESVVIELVREAAEAAGAQRAVLLKWSGDGFRAIASCLRGNQGAEGDELDLSQISWGLVSSVWAEGKTRVFRDALSSDELSGHRSVDSFALRSVACVPVTLSAAKIGVLYMDHRGVAGLFGPEQVGAIQLAAAIIALAHTCSCLAEEVGARSASLRECEDQLVRAERNRLAGEVLSGKAHDIKNILASIAARSQLARQYDDPSRVREALKKVDLAAQQAAKLIQRMQECTIDHETRPAETVRLLDVAREVIEIVAPKSDLGSTPGEVRYVISGDEEAVVEAVPGEIRELVLNLCVNARDAMPDGGELSVFAERDRTQGQAVLEVSDTGTGMNAETRARIFEPFFTTKGKKGTGLGLAIVRRVAVKYGGDVQVNSEDGNGTVFRIQLPLSSRHDSDASIESVVDGAREG